MRDKQSGCPWMLKQTLHTIVPHTLEEAYEVADAVEKSNMTELKNELGDLLYSILIYSDMAEEQGHFDFNDVMKSLEDKITRRHPHLFDPNQLVDNPSLETLEKNWIEIKKQESKLKPNTISHGSILENMSINLPALSYAQKIQKQVSMHGFDWKESSDIIQKLEEETLEFQEALQAKQLKSIQEELGDMLFTVVNLIRFNGFDSEQTLRLANQKFIKRFQLLEERVSHLGKQLADCDIHELEKIWQNIKNQ